jgi:hypothetical protein
LDKEREALIRSFLRPKDEPDAHVAELLSRIEKLTSERDAWKRDFEAELAGNQSLREEFGAREDETFPMFIARLAAKASRAGPTPGISERHVLEELGNIVKGSPLWPGDAISHTTANECVRRGWAKRDSNGFFIPTANGKEALSKKREGTSDHR